MVSWRSIARDPLFESQLESLHPSPARCDEAIAAVEWALALNAEHFPAVPGTRFRLVKTRPFPDIPPLRIFYTVDDEHTCTLRALEVIESLAQGEDDTA